MPSAGKAVVHQLSRMMRRRVATWKNGKRGGGGGLKELYKELSSLEVEESSIRQS